MLISMSRVFVILRTNESAQPAPDGPVLASGYIDQPLCMKRRYHEIYRHIAINKIGLQRV
jgi:hypothetical protein